MKYCTVAVLEEVLVTKILSSHSNTTISGNHNNLKLKTWDSHLIHVILAQQNDFYLKHGRTLKVSVL